MKHIKGLYVTLVLLTFINLSNITIFSGTYSGIAMFLSLGVFIIGTAFYVNAKGLKVSEK